MLHTTADVQGAARSMWGAPHREKSAARSMGMETDAESVADRALLGRASAGFLSEDCLHGVYQESRAESRVLLHLPD